MADAGEISVRDGILIKMMADKLKRGCRELTNGLV